MSITEKKRKHNAEYYKAHKEEFKARHKEYHRTNKEKIHAQKKIYSQANKEKTAARYAKYYESNKEKIKAKVKAYKKTSAGRRVQREGTIKWRKENPEKYLAHKKIYNALRNGILTEQPCEFCGIKKTEAHHEDYSKPLDVVWVCKKHHQEIHLLEKITNDISTAGNLYR